ncbi:uncharacterized protein LOC142228180 [Haematobia irritans]|uniref:uncharacterized protein LOC142228180 n=1 Tax=Haematobia irritans TaxID=7368 RepID=UPI003F50CAF4
MRKSLQFLVVIVLLYNVITTISPTCGQELHQSFDILAIEPDRDKRAVDLGLLVRNLLLKSAYASNTKAAIKANVVNLKTTRRPTTTTTRRPRTTTLAPIFDKKSFWFPFSLSSAGFPPNPPPKVPVNLPRPVAPSGPRGGIRGGRFGDYDYVDQLGPVQQPTKRRRPSTSTAAPIITTTTRTATPPPPPRRPQTVNGRRRPLTKRPNIPLIGDYYDDDYDYGQTLPKTTRPPPPQPRTRRPQGQNGSGSSLRKGLRQNRPTRLRNPAIYQYAQDYDFSINNDADGDDDAATDDADANDNNNANPNDNDDGSDPPTNADDETSQDTNAADDIDYVNNAVANVNVDDAPAFDPNTNSEDDYNDSSDNSNSIPNTNGNGSNGNNISDADSGNNETPSNPAQNPSLDYDYDNGSPPPFNNRPPGAGPPFSQSNFGTQYIDPRRFNGLRLGINRGPSLDPSSPQLGQSFNLSPDYQNFQYPTFNDYGGPQYQQPSSPQGYSVRYY